MPRAGETFKFRWRDRVRCDPGVPARVLKTAFAVSDRMTRDGDQLVDLPPTVEWLMRRTAQKHRKVQRDLRLLERLGYFSVLHAGGGSRGDVRIYKLHFPGVVRDLHPPTDEPVADHEAAQAAIAAIKEDLRTRHR